MKESKKFPVKSHWLNYVNYGLIALILTVIGLYTISLLEVSREAKWIVYFLVINITSMFITGNFILGFVHYKSNHNAIIIDHDSIIVPRRSIIPDSIFIHMDAIIFESQCEENGKDYYQIVYNGGSYKIYKYDLKHSSDWNRLLFELKEVIH